MPKERQYDPVYAAMRHKAYALLDKYRNISQARLKEILQQEFGKYADHGRVQALCIAYKNRRRT
jgi:hypothetical protein